MPQVWHYGMGGRCHTIICIRSSSIGISRPGLAGLKERRRGQVTQKQKRFAEEYVRRGSVDAPGAYKVAYPSCKTDRAAETGASRLLRDADRYGDVQDYVRDLQQAATDDAIADAREVHAYLTAVMRGEVLSEELVVVGIGKGRTEPRHVDKRPDGRERLEAAKQLGRILGMGDSRRTAQAAEAEGAGVIVLPEVQDGQA